MTRFSRFIIAVAAVSPLSFSATGASDPCQKVRAAIELGSVTTKLTVARVDTCQHKILENIKFPADIEVEPTVDYASDVKDKSHPGKLSPAIMDKGLNEIKTLKEIAAGAGATEIAGGAAAAFRQAENAGQFLSEVSDKLHIRIQVMEQRLEGELGYAGALSRIQNEGGQPFVWDIGGLSMQLITKKSDGSFVIYEGALASVPFHDQIISQLEKEDLEKVHTPNPLKPETAKDATELARTYALKDPKFSEEMQRLLKADHAVLYGTGSLFSGCIERQLNKTEITQNDLREALADRSKMSDADLEAELEKTVHDPKAMEKQKRFVKTDVSNLALVLGFMEAFHAETLHIVHSHVADGILVQNEFYK